MAESNTEQSIVSNPETQLNGSNNSDINMSNNETLPATTLEVCFICRLVTSTLLQAFVPT
jgi:hypothetical protein